LLRFLLLESKKSESESERLEPKGLEPKVLGLLFSID
jgi:hypothetical protein